MPLKFEKEHLGTLRLTQEQRLDMTHRQQTEGQTDRLNAGFTPRADLTQLEDPLARLIAPLL